MNEPDDFFMGVLVLIGVFVVMFLGTAIVMLLLGEPLSSII